MANEDGDRRIGGTWRWPDDVDDRLLYQLADYHWTVKRSLRAAAFGWGEAGRDERAAYLDELSQLREKEAIVWNTYFARPNAVK